MRELLCDSCEEQRFTLTPVQSKLLTTMTFNMCNDCREGEMEPRWLIVLAARSGQDVSHWLSNKLYHGDINPDDIPGWYIPNLS